MIRENNKNLAPLDKQMRVKASSSSQLLFFQFKCPYCGEYNVRAKASATQTTLCSRSFCRKVIHIENFKEVA